MVKETRVEEKRDRRREKKEKTGIRQRVNEEHPDIQKEKTKEGKIRTKRKFRFQRIEEQGIKHSNRMKTNTEG